MSKPVFAVFDSKAGMFLDPFCFVSAGLATRWLAQMVNGGDSSIAQFPEDFTLFELGEFDPLTGLLVAHSTPKSVVQAIVLKKEK